jgi:hypothetical protein
MNMKDFRIEKFKNEKGLKSTALEPYNYEGYKILNPQLTEELYSSLRLNRALWKVACGKEISTHWGLVQLEPVWWLDIPKNYAMRHTYIPPIPS